MPKFKKIQAQHGLIGCRVEADTQHQRWQADWV